MVMTKKKWFGFVFLCLWSLTFVFACLSNVIPLGRILLCTFGFITFPLSIAMILINLAIFMGLKYKKDKKSTVYFFLAIFFVLLVIHTINSFESLENLVSFSGLGEYFSYCYQNITFLGIFGAFFSGLITILFGEMGAVVIAGVFATLFIGLFIDYNYYGKYENNIKKLTKKSKNKAVKEKQDGLPDLSFNGQEVFDEISSEDNNLTKLSDSETSFNNDDVFDEIVENPSNIKVNNEEFNRYATNLSEMSQLDLDESRRKFLNDTFSKNFSNGDNYNFSGNDNNYATTSDIDDNLYSSINEISQHTFDDSENNSTSFIDDDLSAILNESEDDGKQETNNNNVDSYNSSDNLINPSINNISNEIKNDIDRFNGGFNFNSQNISNNEQISKPSNFNLNVAMPGVRYNPPPLSLLKASKKDRGDYSEEQARKSAQLEKVLAAFNIPAKVQNIVRGPKITRYELSVPIGVSVKKIPAYEYDIAAALAAKTIVIRAPIPGSNYVGIELENDSFTSVSERELLESDAFQNCKDPLPIAIGKDISGEIIVKSLAKMVHLLIAGSTGSGKSVFIHNVVLSLIYKSSPDDLRLIMIDPKRVEFNRYNGLPHLLTPEVVMGADKALSALKWCVKEMDRRYSLMSKAGYNNIVPYNKSELVKAGQFEKFPYIVIIVDELAEVMMVNKKEVDAVLQRLTQLARACGMHLVVATQRPSVDIITGVIKNNISSRVAFRLQSGIDSKTILNTVGAEKLLGQGDMLLSLTDTSAMPRLQAAYASDEEIKAVIDYDKKYNKAYYDENIQNQIYAEQVVPDVSLGDSGSAGGFATPPQREGVDDYFKEAVKLVMMSGAASISMLQRRYAIGYARAARIIDQMEDKGYISASNGAKTRKVLISPEQFKADFGENFDS